MDTRKVSQLTIGTVSIYFTCGRAATRGRARARKVANCMVIDE